MSSGGGEVVARWWMEDWVGQVAACGLGGSHIRVQINWEEQLRSEADCAIQGSSVGE